MATRALVLALAAAAIEYLVVSRLATLLAPGASVLAMIALNVYLCAVVIASAELLFAGARAAGVRGRWLPWRGDLAEAVRRLAVFAAGAVAVVIAFAPAAARVEVAVARAHNRVMLLALVAVFAAGAGLLAGALVNRWIRRAAIARPRRWLAGLGAAAAIAIAAMWAANRKVVPLVDVRLIAAAATLVAVALAYPALSRLSLPRWLERLGLVAALVLAHLPLGVGGASRALQRASYTDIMLYGGQSQMMARAIDSLLPGPPMSATRFPFAPRAPEIGAPLAEHLVLITVDTLRADHVGAYGYGRDTTPAIDAYFAGALRFERCYTASPATVTSLYSMLYGLYPTRIRWAEKVDPFPATPSPGTSVAEHLRAAGFKTHFATFQTYEPLHQELLVTGFDERIKNPDEGVRGEWLEPRDQRLADAVIEAIEAIDSQPGRHFLWIHFGDPHERYLAHPRPAYFGRRPIDLYDGEIRFTDAAFARVTAALEATEWGKRAAVLLASDHGEGFKEHGTSYHSRTSHDEELRIPCFLEVPGHTSAREVGDPVSSIDVAPTILDVLGVDRGASFDGVSWAALLRGSELAERTLFAMVLKGRPIEYAVIHGTRKAIFTPRPRLTAVYDVIDDPTESQPLEVGEPEIRELTDRLAGWLAATSP